MAERDLNISIKLDRSDLKRNAEASKEDLREIGREAVKSAEVQEQSFKKAGRERVASARAAGQAETQSFDASTRASDGFGASLRRANIEQLALSKVVEVGRAITSVMESAAARTSALAVEANKVRDSLREIGSLKGASGVSDAFMRENTAFIRQTGMTGTEARSFRTAFGGAAALSVGKTIDAGAELDRFERLSAQFAVTKGTDPALLADLAGANLRFKDYLGAGGSDRALGDVAGTFGILEQGAGSTAELVAQQKSLAAGFVSKKDAAGAFANPQEAAAAISVAAEMDPGRSSVIVQQALRAMRGLNDPQGGMLKAAGIGWGDSFRSGSTKLFGAIDKAVAGGATPEQFLSEAGINAEEARAVSVFYGQRGMLASQMAAADAAAGADPRAAVGALDRAYATDKGVRGRLNASALEAAKVERGMATESAELLRGQVEARLFEQGKLDTAQTDGADWWAGLMASPFSSDYQKAGRRLRLNRAALDQLEAQGIHVPTARDRAWTNLPTGREGWEMNSGETDRVLAVGAGRLEALMERQNQLTAEQNAMLHRQAGAPLPTVAPDRGEPRR